MDCHKSYQPYAIPMVCYNFTNHTAPINRYTHTHNSLACKAQGLYNAANAIAHSHCLAFIIIHYTGRNAHTGDQAFKKGVVVDSLALKYRHIFKNGQQKKVSAKRPSKTAKKNKRPTQKSYDQPAWNTAKFPKFGRKTANLATLVENCDKRNRLRFWRLGSSHAAKNNETVVLLRNNSIVHAIQ